MNNLFAKLSIFLHKFSFSGLSFLLFLTSAMTLSTHLAAQPASQQQSEKKEERWFEIEVILFKLKSEDGLTAESWKDDSPLNISQDVVDFLQPYEKVEELDNLKNNLTENKNEIPINGSQAVENNLLQQQNDPSFNQNQSSDISKGAETEIPQGEQPFIRLEDKFLQLTKEANAIKRNRRYQLIEHFSWRQPVDSRKNATKIRIAGGHDYSQSFEYNGEKKIEFIPLPTEINDESIDPDNVDTLTENISSQNSDSDSFTTSNTQLTTPLTNDEKADLSSELTTEKDDLLNNPEIETAKEPEAPKPLDWVPEIDGEIKLYIHRNYLHVDANLVYRKPGEIAVDIFNLDEQPIDYNFSNQSLNNENQSSQPSNDNLIQLNSESILSPNTANTANTANTNSNSLIGNGANNFNLEFDSDFLNKKADKLFTQKLFNYPLIQERRVRSGELHYFDHPLIGMLVMIRPYELKAYEDEIIDTKQVSPEHSTTTTQNN